MKEVTEYKNGWWDADIGDYLKVIANGVVMLQPIIGLTTKFSLTLQQEQVLASLYNLVKFTSPAFIFGIVFTVIRKSSNQKRLNLPEYSKTQWANNFFPTAIWTLIYLLVMPNLQMREHYHNLTSFIWQFFSGNAAPHLWYSVMMLQFLIIMPVIKAVTTYVGYNYKRLWWSVIIIGIIYFSWLYFYDIFVFNGPQANNWYLLDRIFISFLIFGFYGGLAWDFHKELQNILFNYWWVVLAIYLITYFWTRNQFFSYRHLTNLTYDTYYRPSMAIYALAVIFLIYLICIAQKVYKMHKCLKTIHFLAFYAYRAFLANVFWDRILWNYCGLANFTQHYLYLGLVCTWVLTWACSYLSVYIAHQIWIKVLIKNIPSLYNKHTKR